MKIHSRIWTLIYLVAMMALCASCWSSSTPDEPEAAVAQAETAPHSATAPKPNPSVAVTGRPLVIGYSEWAGWWPWYIAEQEDFFAKHGVEVEMRWFDSYLASMEAFAVGELDGNSQTLNDTVSFAPDAVNGEVVVLVNDNSAGNDKIIVAEEIQSIADLAGKKIGLEEGLVEDFLLTLALGEAGLSRNDVDIVNMETGAAAAAFAAGELDGVGAFAPFWLTALERDGSHELTSSAAYLGAIPDLLVVSQPVIDQRPDDVQKLINVWFDVLAFIEENPARANELMAERAGVSVAELAQFKDGTRMFTIEENLTAFANGESLMHMPFAAAKMAQFMVSVGFISAGPEDFSSLFDDQFVRAYADSLHE